MKKRNLAVLALLLVVLGFIGFGSNVSVKAEDVEQGTIQESTIKYDGTATADDETEETTTPEEKVDDPTSENDGSKTFQITKEDLDKIIAAAKSGNVEEVKNLLIGTLGFTAFTILMALIYFVKSKLKYVKESKLLASATESTDERIKALALQIESLTGGLSNKLDDVENGVQKYYEAFNSEKSKEATKKAEEIAKALEVAMNLNSSNNENQEEVETSNEEVKTEE